jgi:hypothetical protein
VAPPKQHDLRRIEDQRQENHKQATQADEEPSSSKTEQATALAERAGTELGTTD